MANPGIENGLKNILNNLKDKLQESPAYNAVADRYANLNPQQQKLTLLLLTFLFITLLLFIPIDNLTVSSDEIQTFETQRNLARDYVKTERELLHMPQLPEAPNGQMIQTLVNDKLKMSNLLPEQIKSVATENLSSQLIPEGKTLGGVVVELNKLNVHQVHDIGVKIQELHPAVKMKDLIIEANREDPRYLNVVYKLILLNVISYNPPVIPIEPKSRTKKASSEGEE